MVIIYKDKEEIKRLKKDFKIKDKGEISKITYVSFYERYYIYFKNNDCKIISTI